MDSDVEKLQSLLLDTNLPSTIHDLRNPTEDFVINLIVTFLTWFKIDINSINKPTFEQQVVMSCIEDTDIVSIINLHVIMRQICDRIFIKDFCISDITNCGSKRIRKFARYLANFILYATNKESDMEDIIKEIHSKAKKLEELQERKKSILTIKNEKAMNIAKQLSLKEKYEMEIQQMQSLIEDNETRKLELQEEMIVIEEKRQKVVEDYNTHKLEAQRLDKTIAELKLEVVKSPEEYKTRLYNLEEQNKAKIEEREKMQETFLAKNELVKKYENILSFVQKQYEKFSEIRDIYGHLKKTNIQGENIKKQVDTMKNDITELIKKHKMQEDHQGSTIDEIHAQTKERLTAVRELHAQLLSNKKLALVKLEENKVLYNDSCMDKNKIKDLVKKIEGETSAFIKNCQELYNNEIRNEINLQKCFNKAWEESHNTVE
ncbi:probable kinetochore protein nuf2 [Vespa crabro]|uniref:probable kinetochore protein nuf2 n=1 Tax=Vespa crabro TaxID=7445 RepID=UPI001F015BE7|nr:probable kinetochore protein nuf2 [Vespa crabro]